MQINTLFNYTCKFIFINLNDQEVAVQQNLTDCGVFVCKVCVQIMHEI